jgi:membrane protease YdiL (CAAX protease family)
VSEPDAAPATPEIPAGEGLYGVPPPAEIGASPSFRTVAAPGEMPKLRAAIEIVLCSGLPTQLVIASTLRLVGWSPVDAQGKLTLGFVTALSLLDTALLIGLMIWLMRSRGQQPSVLWLGRRSVAGEAVVGMLYVPIVFFIVAVLMLTVRKLAPQLHNVDINPFEALAGRAWKDAALLLLVAVFAGGLREELQRAFLLDRFERHLGPAWLGVVLLSIAFGLGHLMQGQDAAVATGALGAFWAVIYLRRRSAVAPFVSHALFDSLQVMQIIALAN